MSEHIGELAALYALGALDVTECEAADRHLAGCDACRRLLAQAQADVAAMEAERPQHEPPKALRERLERTLAGPTMRPARGFLGPWLAIAAAVAIAIGPAGYLMHQNAAMRASMTTSGQALARIAARPHRTVAFTGMNARVMYAKDGSWYVVVVRGAQAGLAVVWPHDGTQTMLGTATTTGDVALLYLPKSHRMNRLTLVRNGRVVGQAQLVF